MPKAMFPVKKSGDGLSHQHVNNLGRVLTNLSGGNQGTFLQGTSGWITGVAASWNGVDQVARVVDETSTSDVYNVLIRTWNESSGEWDQEDDEYLLDARCFSKDESAPQRGPVLVCKDLLSVRWDRGRGAYVPLQMLYPNSRWAWCETSIAARSAAAVSSQMGKLVEEVLNAAGTVITWTYLKDDDDNDISVRVFNGFPDDIPASLHVRIGHNSLGQYEVKGVPCSADAELV